MLQEPEKFNCSACECDEEGLPPGVRECRGKQPGRHEVRTDAGELVVKTNRCLRKLITPQTWALVGLFRHYRNGVLPYGGGLLDQPAVYVEAMSLLEANIASKPGG